MPWWVFVYLCVLALVSVAGCRDNLRSSMRWWMQGLGILSAVFSVVFVFAFFYRSVGESIGYLIIPMLMTAVGWDVYEMHKDLSSMRRDSEVSQQAQNVTEYIVIAVVGLVVVPAYLAGIATALRLF